MVGDSQFDMWIVVVKDFEFVQEKETQGDFAGSDIYQSAFESFVFEKFVFSGHKLFNGDGNVFIKAFALEGELNTAVGTDEKFASQIVFENVHAAGDIGLIVSHDFGCFGKAFVLGNIIKDAVIIKNHTASSPCGI